jgi:WD40 repeat protein
MKRLLFTVFLVNVVFPLTSFAQDNTKAELPEGAIARLGKGGINIMRFSPDGTRLAVGTDVGVWVYDVPSGKETALFTEHPGQINALAFSTDGKILASGGFANPVIQLWDLTTDSRLTTLKLAERHDSITALAFSEDNTILISLDTFGDIIYWDVETGSKLLDPRNVDPVDTYEIAALSPNSSMAAIGDKNGTQIHLWNTTTGKRWVTLNGHTNFFKEGPNEDEKEADIQAMAFTSDGKTLVSGSEDKTVQLWNTNGAKRSTLRGHQGWITTVAFSANGEIVASGDTNKIIKTWDVDTGRERATLIGHKNTINALTFAPEGTSPYSGCLASGSADGTIRFWDPETGQELITFTVGHTEWVKAVAFFVDGTTLASAAFNGTVEIWSLMTKRELITFTAGQSDLAELAVLSPDGKFFVTRGYNGPIAIAFNPYGWGARSNPKERDSMQLWKITTNEQLPGPWQNVADTTISLTFSPENKILANRGPQDVRAWNLNTGVQIFGFNTITPFPKKLMFSSNGTLLAVYGIHGTPQVWDVNAKREFPTFTDERASSLAFSPDDVRLALGHTDSITLWNVTKTGIQEHSVILDNHRGFSDILIFSPDGKTLLDSKWSESRIQLWDVDTGSSLGTLSGHTEPIETLVFSHDGKTLASGSEDGTVLLWDWAKIIAKQTPNNKGN